MYQYARIAKDIPHYKLRVEGEPGEADSLADRLQDGIQQSADICQISPPVCVGNLGIPRSKMPQLKGRTVDLFIESFQRRGIRVRYTSMPVGRLKATQREISAKSVLRMVTKHLDGRYPELDRQSIIVSKDHYILDGHHRWASLLTISPSKRVPVILIDAPIRQLLDEANTFEGVTRSDFGEDRHTAAVYV